MSHELLLVIQIVQHVRKGKLFLFVFFFFAFFFLVIFTISDIGLFIGLRYCRPAAGTPDSRARCSCMCSVLDCLARRSSCARLVGTLIDNFILLIRNELLEQLQERQC